MVIDILMPAASPTMTEGKIVRWLKSTGDLIVRGEVLAEIETDKAVIEMEASDDGTLGEVIVSASDASVPVRTAIAKLYTAGSSIPPERHTSAGVTDACSMPHREARSQVLLSTEQTQMGEKSHRRQLATPLAKNYAKQTGVDLAAVKGTGPNGRIIKADVGDALSQFGERAAQLRKPAASDLRQRADLLEMSYDLKANSSFRKTIARRLSEAKPGVPHFYLTLDCRIDALLQLREELNKRATLRLSINDFAIRAAALAARQTPEVNASWAEDANLSYGDIDISVAVATTQGVIAPILRKADTKAVTQISAEMHHLVMRARAGTLKPQEYDGGTLSLSNLGTHGIKEFAAIINPPHACILALGQGEPRVIVDSGNAVIATVMTCTLSLDHRVVDGAVGASFLRAFKAGIENPQLLND